MVWTGLVNGKGKIAKKKSLANTIAYFGLKILNLFTCTCISYMVSQKDTEFGSLGVCLGSRNDFCHSEEQKIYMSEKAKCEKDQTAG